MWSTEREQLPTILVVHYQKLPRVELWISTARRNKENLITWCTSSCQFSYSEEELCGKAERHLAVCTRIIILLYHLDGVPRQAECGSKSCSSNLETVNAENRSITCQALGQDLVIAAGSLGFNWQWCQKLSWTRWIPVALTCPLINEVEGKLDMWTQTTHLAYIQFSLNLLRFTKAFILGSGVGLKIWLSQSYNSSTKICLQDRVHSLLYLFQQVMLHLELFCISACTFFEGMLYVLCILMCICWHVPSDGRVQQQISCSIVLQLIFWDRISHWA